MRMTGKNIFIMLHVSSTVKPTTEMVPIDGCIPSPCGPNSECRLIGNTVACSCLPNYIGRPPNCRPECTINEECPGNLACQNNKCRDPCPGSCGLHAVCVVVNHSPQCTCESGFTGDPFSGCTVQQSKPAYFKSSLDIFALKKNYTPIYFKNECYES